MALTKMFVVGAILTFLISSPATAQTTAPPSLSPAPAPAPSPAFVNLAYLLSVAGPFHTFLNYLLQTQVIQTFQDQVNNTDQGITIFVPEDSAFSSLKKASFSNLTQDQLKSLLLLHALPKYYSLSDFKKLSSSGPVSTFAGGQYTLNLTDESGLIQVGSDWSNPNITSSVYSTKPVAIYEVDHVLLPKAIFDVAPPLAPAPAPAPDAALVADVAPSGLSGSGSAPESSESSTSDSSSHIVSVGGLSCLALAASAGLMVML